MFSTTGGAGLEAQKLLKKIAEKMESHPGQRYADAMGFIRKRIRFELLKTTVIALRGHRGKARNSEAHEISELDLNLEPSGNLN